MPDTGAAVQWRADGVPVSGRFDDPYFSLDNGLAETRHVFLGGNNLPQRFRPGFHIGELGFGSGLNALAVAQAWLDAGQGGRLRFTSFEAYPMSADETRQALALFPDLAALAAVLVDAIADGVTEITLPGCDLTVIHGDARQSLPAWHGLADAWFLDGFAPAKNPELWEPGLLQAVADHTAPGGTLATYSAAGALRRGLDAAGFRVERAPGYGRKRHMTRAALTRS